MHGGGELRTLPPGRIPGWLALDAIDSFGPKTYVVVTNQGVFITKNITAAAVSWTRLGATSPPCACSVKASGDAASPTYTVEAGSCTGRQRAGFQADTLWQFGGTTSTGAWRRIQPPGNAGGFGTFGVDRTNGKRIAAAHLRPNGPAMIFSSDGGSTNDGGSTSAGNVGSSSSGDGLDSSGDGSGSGPS